MIGEKFEICWTEEGNHLCKKEFYNSDKAYNFYYEKLLEGALNASIKSYQSELTNAYHLDIEQCIIVLKEDKLLFSDDREKTQQIVDKLKELNLHHFITSTHLKSENFWVVGLSEE